MSWFKRKEHSLNKTMAGATDDSIYRRWLSCKGKGKPILEIPRQNSGSFLTYCRLQSILHMQLLPVVSADSPLATDIIEKRMESLKKKPAVMVTEADVKAYLLRESGRDRLKDMFSKTEDGRYSTEMQNISFSMFNACGCAFVLASIFTSRRAKEEYLENNRATVFKTKFRAERYMNDTIITAVMKDGAKWAFRIGSFLLPFLLVSQSIAVYRNKSSPWEYAAGSAVAGCLMKMNLGLKGCIAGGIVGGAMGIVTGGMIYGLMYAAGECQEDRHFREIQAKIESEREFQAYLPSEKKEETV